MKYVRGTLLALAALMFFQAAYAEKCLSSEGPSVATVEQLLKAEQYEKARDLLKEVIAACPSSTKAKFYLEQTQQRIDKKKSEAKEKDNEGSMLKRFLIVVFVGLISLGLVWVLYLWQINRNKGYTSPGGSYTTDDWRDRDEREEIYSQVLQLRETIEDLIIEKGLEKSEGAKQDVKKLYALRDTSVDLVEVCLKDISQLDIKAAKAFFKDAERIILEVKGNVH